MEEHILHDLSMGISLGTPSSSHWDWSHSGDSDNVKTESRVFGDRSNPRGLVMSRLRIITQFVLIALATSFGTAQAALISAQSDFGLDTVTVDTSTGLRWLDVTLSTDYSYDEIQAQLGHGGMFEGFRLASRDEVSTLFSNAGIPLVSGSFVAENYDPVRALMDLVGITGTDGNLGTGIPFDYTVGHMFDPVPPREGWVWVATLSAYDPNQTARASVSSSVPSDNQNDRHGSWLVAVPEPSTVVLILVGLLLLAPRRVRSRALAVVR